MNETRAMREIVEKIQNRENSNSKSKRIYVDVLSMFCHDKHIVKKQNIKNVINL